MSLDKETMGADRSPAYAGSRGCQAVEECAAGVLRSLGEGGHASAGSAEDTKGTTAVKPWGSTTRFLNRTRLPRGGSYEGRNKSHPGSGARCRSGAGREWVCGH